MSLGEITENSPRIEVDQRSSVSKTFDLKKCLLINLVFLSVIGVLIGSLGFGRVGELSRLGMLGSGLCFGVSVIVTNVCYFILKTPKVSTALIVSGGLNVVPFKKEAVTNLDGCASTFRGVPLRSRENNLYTGRTVKSGMDTKGFDFDLDDLTATQHLAPRLHAELSKDQKLDLTQWFGAVNGRIFVRNTYPTLGFGVDHWVDCHTQEHHTAIFKVGDRVVISDHLRRLYQRWNVQLPSDILQLYIGAMASSADSLRLPPGTW